MRQRRHHPNETVPSSGSWCVGGPSRDTNPSQISPAPGEELLDKAMEMRIRDEDTESLHVRLDIGMVQRKHDIIPLITTPQLHIAITILDRSLQIHDSSDVEG